VYRGDFLKMVARCNDNTEWRAIFGPPSARMKDQELVIRFMALYCAQGADTNVLPYGSPMKAFLNRFCAQQRDAAAPHLAELESIFVRSVTTLHRALGRRAFRVGKVLNAAAFDAVMVGVATRVARRGEVGGASLSAAYSGLIDDGDFRSLVGRTTANPDRVRERIKKAIDAFDTVE
jgi:hypothetical protein